MENEKLQFKWISYITFVIFLIQKQAIALKTMSIEDCFETSMKNDTPSCTFQMSEEAHKIVINCVAPGILRIIGDYKAVYINCSANYPLDFNFDGHKPTEAIDAVSWAMVEQNSDRKFKSHHLDVKIFSIPSLHDHFVALYPHKQLTQRNTYNYSRTGSYIFSGYFEQERLQSKFYIFFEENSALRSFLRNEDVVVRLPNLKNSVEEHLPLIIPCRPSHFSSNVTIQQNGTTFDFSYDAVVGFASNKSWKSIIENNPNLNHSETIFTCVLNQNDDLVTFSTKDQGTKYGHDGLPTTESPSVLTKSDTLKNGSLTIEHHCDFEEKSHGIGVLAVHDVVNPAMNRLLRHFIFPKFFARSYSTNFSNTTLRFGGSVEQITTKSSVSNVFSEDARTFHTAFVGVGAIGRHVTLPFEYDAIRSKFTGNRPTSHYFKILHDQPNNALYENQIVVFRCFIASYTFIRPAIWYTVRANGSVAEEAIDYDWKDNYFSHAQIKLTGDVRKILVAASIFYKHEWRNFSTDINFEMLVIEPIKSRFDDSEVSIQKFHLNSNQFLKCTAIGVPEPTIHWQRNGKLISSRVSIVNHTSILEFPNIQQKDAGEYVCVAANVASVEKKIFNVQVLVETDLGLIIGLSVSVFICGAVAIIAVWVYFKLLGIGKAALTKSEINDFLNGECDENDSMEGNSDGKEYAHDFTHVRPYNTDREFEIPEKRFHINLSEVLGSGAFGMVVMGTLDGVPVAVKTVKRKAEKSYLKALLSELKMMTFLGEHENIVGLLGASTGNLSRGQVFIFVPFCALGSLQNYLRKNRLSFQNDPKEYVNVLAVSRPSISSEVITSNPNVNDNTATIMTNDFIPPTGSNCSEPMPMTTNELYQWATQIANGMEYLSSKKVLHGDLAARNVVLTENRIAKITDFGLSRRLYDCSEYAKTQQEPLPWRWMSVESLRDLTFSTKSDVWSYGITLWEIFSLGQVPYPGYSWTMDFVRELESGMRMSCPQFASEELYNAVMKKCWHNDPELRPSFAQIQIILSTIY